MRKNALETERFGLHQGSVQEHMPTLQAQGHGLATFKDLVVAVLEEGPAAYRGKDILLAGSPVITAPAMKKKRGYDSSRAFGEQLIITDIARPELASLYGLLAEVSPASPLNKYNALALHNDADMAYGLFTQLKDLPGVFTLDEVQAGHLRRNANQKRLTQDTLLESLLDGDLTLKKEFQQLYRTHERGSRAHAFPHYDPGHFIGMGVLSVPVWRSEHSLMRPYSMTANSGHVLSKKPVAYHPGVTPTHKVA